MFIVALLIIALNNEQPNVLQQVNSQINHVPFHTNEKEQTYDTCNNLDEFPENYTEINGGQELGLGERDEGLTTKKKLKEILS